MVFSSDIFNMDALPVIAMEDKFSLLPLDTQVPITTNHAKPELVIEISRVFKNYSRT